MLSIIPPEFSDSYAEDSYESSDSNAPPSDFQPSPSRSDASSDSSPDESSAESTLPATPVRGVALVEGSL